MKIEEMVKEFGLKISVRGDQEGIAVNRRKPTRKELEELKNAKAEIVTFLKNEKIQIENQKRALEAAHEAHCDELIASGQTLKAVVYSGSYLIDRELAWVIKMTPEEETPYVDELKGRMYKFVRTIKKVERVCINPDRPGDGVLNQESNIWVLSPDELKNVEEKIVEYEAEETVKLEAEKKKAAKTKSDYEAKFIKAKETGGKVELDRHMDECDDPKEDCSYDIVVRWVMPDGSIKVTRNHTW